MRIARYYCLMLGIAFVLPAFSQETSGNNYLISSEAMHVHFDKDIYLPGETIWFKAYLYNINEISYSSTNFYVAIYDDKGTLIQQKQYPVLEGSANGDFEIPDTIRSNRIQFRAFTKGMIIDDSTNVYEKILAVYNKEKSTGEPAVNKAITLQFFPEGGQIITELQNHIAFIATYPDGSPAMVSGQIIQSQRDVLIDSLDSFSTSSLGLGKLVLTALPYKKYKAIWKDENGIMRETPLPAVTRFGVSFHAEVINKELQYTIARNRSSDSLSLLHLVAQMGNYEVYKADLVIPNEMEPSVARFPIDSVPAGLLQLTLFDKGWSLLQQRLVYVSGETTRQDLTVITDTINTKPKGKNVIEIILPDTGFTNLSASIADINFYDRPRTYSIDQDFLFNRQLKDIRTNTDSLLRAGDENTINLVSLTHDWRKYNWQKMIDKRSVKAEVLDNYISISVKYKEKNLALPRGDALNLIVNNKGAGRQFYNLKPSDQTTFKKDGLLFFDSLKIAYQMDKNKDLVNYLRFSRDSGVKIPSSIPALPYTPEYTAGRQAASFNRIDTFFMTEHKKFNDVQTIKGVTVRSAHKGNPQLERIDELDRFYTNGMFSGTVKGYQLNVIDDTIGVNSTANLVDYMRYRLPTILVYDNTFYVRRYLLFPKPKDTLIPVITFINEVETPSNEAALLNMWDVAYVKYVPGIVLGAGFMTSTGAIYIYTKKGNEKGPPSAGLPFVYIKGYTSPKEFISPDYSDKTLLNEPDLRPTLYWNPYIIMDKTNNNVKIEYYNNDVSKKMLLTIEGVNAKGKLIHIEKIIE